MAAKLRPANPASAMLRKLVDNFDQYKLDAESDVLISHARVVLAEYKEYFDSRKLSDEMIAKVQAATGSIRKIANELNLSHETVRKYRPRLKTDR